MEINKFNARVSNNEVRLYLPISKVDKERRIVSGFATLDNTDSHNDVVTASSSQDAFKNFKGNIREMHAPKAVGRMVDFTERKAMNPSTGEEHNGIYVEVYVSKGAEDTWLKVDDGTLNGFSIGGAIDDFEPIVTGDGSRGRKITKYHLNELSLVDAPANPLAKVFSIEKSGENYEFTGFATEEHEEDFGGAAGTTTNLEDTEVFPSEETSESKFEKFFDKFDSFLEKTIGGTTMTTKTEETAVEEVETEDEVVEDTTEETVEKAADVSEVEVDDTSEDTDEELSSLVKRMENIESVLERLSKSVDTDDEVAEDESSVTEEVSDELDETNEGLAKAIEAIEGLTETVSALKDETTNRLEALEDASAVKKSASTGRGLKKVRDDEEGFWSGTALGSTKTSADTA